MSVQFRILSFFLILFSLTSSSFASANPGKSYKSLTDLKTSFVKAGGQCWEWRVNPRLEDRTGGDCDKMTTIIFFTRKTDTLAEALNFAKFERSSNFQVHLLVGPNWMINSDQVKSVYKKMGGTLITR